MEIENFDTVIISLLKKHDGVFFGEAHDAPALRQSVTRMLPILKCSGVETLSIELPQNMVDEMLKAKDFKELQSTWPVIAANPDFVTNYQSTYDIVKFARQLGMRVLGHEKPDPEIDIEADMKRNLISMTDEEKCQFAELVDKKCKEHTSENGMKARDAYARDYINARKIGKTIVIGGSDHSGNYTAADLPHGFWNALLSVPPPGLTVTDNYQGLDAKLGFPSIDYVRSELFKKDNTTEKSDGKFQHYKVFLPQELGQLPAPTPPPKATRERAQTMAKSVR